MWSDLKGENERTLVRRSSRRGPSDSGRPPGPKSVRTRGTCEKDCEILSVLLLFRRRKSGDLSSTKTSFHNYSVTENVLGRSFFPYTVVEVTSYLRRKTLNFSFSSNTNYIYVLSGSSVYTVVKSCFSINLSSSLMTESFFVSILRK